MSEANVADFSKKTLSGVPYEKTAQGSLSGAKEAKEKGAGLEGKGLPMVGVTLSDVPVNGVAYPKERGANGNKVDAGIWAKADIRTLTNDNGKSPGAGK